MYIVTGHKRVEIVAWPAEIRHLHESVVVKAFQAFNAKIRAVVGTWARRLIWRDHEHLIVHLLYVHASRASGTCR